MYGTVGNPGSLGEAIQVKERQKIYTGLLVAVGSKQEVQQKLNAIEGQSSKEQVPEPVPTVPAESQPRASKKQGIKCLIVSADCCATDCIELKLYIVLSTGWFILLFLYYS